jgi:hypothetical protein
MLGVGLRARRSLMLRARALDVLQPAGRLIVTAVAALLDHRLRRQPGHVLPRHAEMRRQTVRGHDIVGRHAALNALRRSCLTSSVIVLFSFSRQDSSFPLLAA